MANEKQLLIDAHDLWSDIMMLPHNGDMISSEEVEQAIMDAPTVDAVEVTRCKDCKFWNRFNGYIWCLRNWAVFFKRHKNGRERFLLMWRKERQWLTEKDAVATAETTSGHLTESIPV